MNFKTVIGTLSLLLLLAIPGFAQQDPNDQGGQDSVFFVVTPPVAGAADDSTFKMEIYFSNDVQKLASASCGFKWDRTDVRMKSAAWTADGLAAWDFVKYLYRSNNIAQTNLFRNFQASGARQTEEAGLPASATPTKLATYNFVVDNWTVNDSIVVDTNAFAAGAILKFVAPPSVSYIPRWPGKIVIHDPNYVPPSNFKLQVSDAVLNFSAQENDPNPASKNFTVSEETAHPIAYTSTESAAWMSLTNPDGTTPGIVTVNPDITGLTAGTYTDSIQVSSLDATNSPVYVKVILTVTPRPKVLVVSPLVLNFEVTEGGNPDAKSFHVSEQLGAAISYNSATDAAWVLLTNPSGMTPGDVGVDVNMTGKTPGVYNDSILVVAGAATNPEIWVMVNLTVNAAPKVLAVDSTILNFEATEGDGNPAAKSFQVTEAGGAIIAFDATETAAWFSLLDASGNTPGTVTVNVDIAGLAPNMYVDSIQVAAPAANNSPKWVRVHLMVNPRPKVLVVTPLNLNFAVTVSSPVAAPKTFDVSEQGGAAIAYAASESATWITLTDGAGTTPKTVTVNVDGTGLSVGTYEDTIAVVAAATNSPQKVAVKLVVSSCPVLVGDPLSFNLVGLVGDSLTLSETVSVTSSGSNLDFAAAATPNFAFDPVGGITPGVVGFQFKKAYATAGTYTECFTIGTTGELVPADCDPSSVQVCIHVTVNEPPKHLVVSPTSLDFTALLGGPNPEAKPFLVSEQDDAVVAFAVTEGAGWFALNKTSGNTPDSVVVTPDITGLAAGTYTDSVQVTSAAVVNSPQWVKVNLIISECPILALNKTAIYDTIFLGDTYTKADSLLLTSTSPDELSWHAIHDGTFVLSSDNGTTPSVVGLTFTVTPATAGTYQYCVTFATDEPTAKVAQICNSQVSYCVNLLVVKPASADTLVVVNTPAVPGARVVVPINFKNGCDFKSAEFGLHFNPAEFYLDSVSFANSRITFFELQFVTIDNVLGTVTIKAIADDAYLVPTGFGNLADMHFTVRPDASAGEKDFAVMDSVVFGRNCGTGLVYDQPISYPGSINVGFGLQNFTCGTVVDTLGNDIPGATVLLYADWPNGSPIDSTVSTAIGSFAFSDFSAVPFDVYAYKKGYYPGRVENLNFREKGEKIVLKPLKDITFEKSLFWVDYICGTGDNMSTLFGAPIPVGSVVEAYTPEMLLVGQCVVDSVGHYGPLHVYAADDETATNGARTDQAITFYVNGIPATPSVTFPGDHMYPRIEVCVEAGEEVTKTCTLQEGWNLVSWNVNTASDDIKTVLGPYLNCVDVVLGFDQGGMTYDPELEEFSDLWSVDHLHGYWIKVKPGCSVTLELTGTAVPVSTPIPVTKGWNLVSYLPETSMKPADGFASIFDQLLYAYGWDEGIKFYSPNFADSSLTLSPCNGYWVKIDANGTLVYPGDETVATPRYVVQNSNIAAAAGDVATTTAWVNLYATNLKVDGNVVSAGAVITAHSAADGTKVGIFTMTTSGKFGFMPVYADASSALKPGDAFYLSVDGVETQEQFTWTANGDRMEVGALTTAAGAGTLPASFALGQNYPNPFNPSTTISFSLPVAGNAKVEIYNVLGALVAVPFDGMATAGSTTVVWDGKDLNGQSVASGIYLYRLSAGAASETKKMMLLK